ncbi:zinc finger protein KNUCKLES-like [Phoenix dactylifera]|uniref:Zinc finger protein KNUCKLES-like n=1 Tax=Phoenix dactylifera TaxID=42345 RepID=A0A8B9AIG2_PHODC|nr:zinc finger protein KNUCKLES-like [Phoenix dactylifera]
MANQEMKGKSTELVEMKGARRKLFMCQYCDKAFTSSQALGGHQNGHRNEREIAKKTKQEIEIHGIQNPFVSMPTTLLHNTRQGNLCLPLYSPYHTTPAPTNYHPFHIAKYLYSTHGATSHGQRFSSEYSFNGSSNDRAMLINEEHLKFLNWKRNYRLQLNACSEIRPNTMQASKAEPSSSTNINQNLQQDGNKVKDGRDNKERKIDLTLHL